jgi:hypothetical protein
MGSAAYVISRDAAAALLAVEPSGDQTVDIFLWEFKKTPSQGLNIYQVVPAPAVQGNRSSKYSRPSTVISDIAYDRSARAIESGEAALLQAFRNKARRKGKLPLRSAYYRLLFGVRVGPVTFDEAQS